MQQLKLFELFDAPRLPKKPYCSDDLTHGLMIRPLRTAIQKRYIQPNRPGFTTYLTFDIDRPDAGAAWLDSLGVPAPSFIVKNPENGHAHYIFTLAAPVCTTDAARLKPLRYLAAIERSISLALGADDGFTRLIIKNPVHQHWQTLVVETQPYSLEDLARNLDLDVPAANGPQSLLPIDPHGLARNCVIFDHLRFWAYKSVADYWRPAGEAAWASAVREHAHSLNWHFVDPLDVKEVDQIAKSVSRWVWKRFSPARRRELIERTHTSELQAERGAKKGAAKRQELMDRAMLLTLSGHSTREIGAELGVSAMTVSNWIKRAKAGKRE